MAFNAEHIKWFRDSSPYIDAHRGRTFVVCLSEGALDSGNLGNIISDLSQNRKFQYRQYTFVEERLGVVVYREIDEGRNQLMF